MASRRAAFAGGAAPVSDQDVIRWPAPAKINLFLHVTGRRADGYHELQTLFQLLDWGDHVTIGVRDDGLVERPIADYDVPEDQDLVVRAARLLKSVSGSPLGATIRVDKQVPTGSGLGGGSSDAATVLLVLNHRWQCGLSLDRLADIGATLGADVPVFVRGRSALATGIGEVLTPVSTGERCFLLVFPEFSISTREIFSDPLLSRNSPRLSLDQIEAGEGVNDCEAIVRRRYPALDELLDELQQYGNARMTGTGSAVFVPMPDRKSAISTARKIKCRYNVRAVRGVDRSPLHSKLEEFRSDGQRFS